MQPWKTISRRVLCSPNKFLTVESHELELPDGRRINDWPWLITPDYANVLARTAEGRFLCFRQTKYAVDGVSLAPVGGFVDKGETPLAAAQRELLEETGYAASDWHTLGSYAVDANRGAGTAHLFLALNATPHRSAADDDLEQQELLFFTEDELSRALDLGEFKVLAWAATIALGLRYLAKEAGRKSSKAESRQDTLGPDE